MAEMFTLKQLFLLVIFLTALMQNVAFTHDKSDKILAKKIFRNFTVQHNYLLKALANIRAV